MFNFRIRKILIVFRVFFASFFIRLWERFYTFKACFRASNSLKFKVFWDSALEPAETGLQRFPDPLPTLYSLRSQRSGQSQNVLWHVCNVSVFIWKQYPENFTFLILRILELFSVKFINFSKSRLIFTFFYCFSMFVNKLFTYPRKRCFSVKPSTSYFQVKTKILADFEICISAPLRTRKNSKF